MAVGSDSVPTLRGSDIGTLEVEGAEAESASIRYASTHFQEAPGAEPAEVAPGRVVAKRYRLVERLGAGAHGEVWAADDLVLREPVALKWMGYAVGKIQARIRQEITTLRMLRMPGVVRLLDDGVEDGRPFLVMDRVHGTPFPGGPALRDEPRARWTWADLAGPTAALLEVLARVHAAGVVHRDLKPDNILVSAEGQPTLLDFGISLWRDTLLRDEASRLTGAGQILGTPYYLAPEQIGGGAVDARTDLYAVGVMLYELLTGAAPHEAQNLVRLLQARMTSAPLPVHERAPDVPAFVAAGVDRLLELRMERRFQSAAEALAALRGEPTPVGSEPALPRLGGRRVIAAVLDAIAVGRSIDVVGPPGSGRTRCLEEVAESLALEGRSVVRARPARAPLASLWPIVGLPDEDAGLRLTEITARVEAGLRAKLAAGVILIADDADRIDPWSSAMLDRCRDGPGAFVRALPAAPPGAQEQDIVALEPLDEEALRPLFVGPDRIFHLREDAARALWERTEGLPARIEAEVTLWTRLGLARWDGARLVLDRDALGRLRAGLPTTAHEQPATGGLEGEPHLEELLRWLDLGGRHLEPEQLAQAMGEPLWKVEAECEALVARGAARRIAGERVVARRQVDAGWSSSRRLAAHRAISRALRPGQDGRLFHLLAAEDVRQAVIESIEVARRHGSDGDLGGAMAALAEGLCTARRQDAGDAANEEVRVLEVWVEVAFAEATPRALDRVLYELSRVGRRGPEIERLESLVRAGIAAPGASGSRALELAEEIPPFTAPELERRRHRVRVVAAATRSSPAQVEQVLAEVAAWAARSGEPLAQLSLAEGEALLRYVQGRFDEAAALHAEAARREPWLTGRIAATLKCASTLLEAFQHQEAAERAAEGRELAARCRHAHWEGRAEWLLRAARYRMGEATEPDDELVFAVAQLGVHALEALVDLNEAAVAFRAGRSELAAELSGRAARLWKEMDRPWAELLARCLSIASGAAAQEGEVDALVNRAIVCPVPGIGVQALGLLGRTSPDTLDRWRDSVEERVKGIPQERWHLRMDVLSVEEALRGLWGSSPSQVT